MSAITSVWDSGSSAPSGAAGGDLSGTYPNPTVATVGGKSAAAVGAMPSTTSTVPVWSSFKPAASPHASNDYFDDASLTGWTNWDPGSTSITRTETAATRLKMTQASQSGAKHAGIFKAVPVDTRFTITCDLAIAAKYANYVDVGMFVAEDLASSPTTASILLLNFAIVSTGTAVSLQSWSKYDTYTATHSSATFSTLGGHGVRLGRIYVDTVGNTYEALVSTDGLNWCSLGTAVAQASTQITGDPTHMGLCISNNGTGAAASLYSRMFRIDATTDPYLECGGWVSAAIT